MELIREECVLHANCQGEPLAMLLGMSPEFSARWRIRHFTNYIREMIPGELLQKATLFLYQPLGPDWGDLSSASLLARLGKNALPVCIPNMFFTGYWPFWTKKSPMDFGDYFLDKLFESGAGKPEILRIYLSDKVRGMADFDGVAAETLRLEKAKEEQCDVKTADFVAENWRKMPLFQTVNHPGTTLLILVAQGILAKLGLPPLSRAATDEFAFDYEGFSLPIHPRVAAYHNLPFAGEGAEYPVFGRSMTFERYVSRYIECRINHFEANFLQFLQLV